MQQFMAIESVLLLMKIAGVVVRSDALLGVIVGALFVGKRSATDIYHC